MKFAFLLYESPSDFAARTNDDKETYWAAWSAYSKSLGEAGVITGGKALHPPTMATTVRLQDGKRHVQDGPFADTKEQLGGFMVIDVPDLDEALNWAARCPCTAVGAIEVRPIWEIM